MLPLESLGVKECVSYDEVSLEILDSQVRKMRKKEVSYMNVLWRFQLVEGAAFEAKAEVDPTYDPQSISKPIKSFRRLEGHSSSNGSQDNMNRLLRKTATHDQYCHDPSLGPRCDMANEEPEGTPNKPLKLVITLHRSRKYIHH
ncbi:hypothetical protein MTR67_002122 [Solanum verrucosum]|uniref:Uncharacterized protein n=1 Tax=Solanum verrucosum TaxID=315347 RepID=A0AAF0T5M1_SOLVR|nr:hypothetical protein MTR67_002122 [Solanum verrucosum]